MLICLKSLTVFDFIKIKIRYFFFTKKKLFNESKHHVGHIMYVAPTQKHEIIKLD